MITLSVILAAIAIIMAISVFFITAPILFGSKTGLVHEVCEASGRHRHEVQLCIDRLQRKSGSGSVEQDIRDLKSKCKKMPKSEVCALAVDYFGRDFHIMVPWLSE